MLNKPVFSLPLKCNHAQNGLFRYSVPAASNIKKTVDALCFSPNHRETAMVEQTTGHPATVDTQFGFLC